MTDVLTGLAPVRDADSAEFWSGVERGELVLPVCDACGRWIYYPRALCPSCGGGELTQRTASGAGSVYSFTVARRAPHPALADAVPYIVALIDLAEGARMLAWLVDCAPESAAIGMAVQFEVREVVPGLRLPVFTAREGGEEP